MMMGKDRDAIPFLKIAATDKREQYLTLMNLAIAYQRSNQLQASRLAYRQSLDLAEKELARDPRDGVVRARVAKICARLGNTARAESEIKQALRLSPDDYSTRTVAVQTYEALGQRDDALAILKTSPGSVLSAAMRWPELSALVQDPRFQQLVASHQVQK